MLKQYISYFLSIFISTSVAVTCDFIERRFGEPLIPGQPRFDPLAPGQGWQVVKLENCWGMRVHAVTKEQDPRPARVTTTSWTATPQQVLSTIQNYHNALGTNIMLWLKPTTYALQYCGILNSLNTGLHVTPQWSKPYPWFVVSIILPLPTSTLRYVDVPSENSADEDCKRVWAFGANGQISASDYAYTSLGSLYFAMENKMEGEIEKEHDKYMDPPPQLGRKDGAWFAAETSNPNTCVVIDLTTFPGLLP
ncbi:hypothetical protein BKA64DRAFT_130512 [Cadophora sp. MPI-SDFR-AT-0126]|nr:hypothetical protein BKA64DRAFT_130512 [Leotiomycetes sp. MPI-SDFR-AT-0126]